MATRKKASENQMGVPVETSPGVFKLTKPTDQEFFLEEDFEALAESLSLPMNQIAWVIVDETVNGVDVHSLVAQSV